MMAEPQPIELDQALDRGPLDRGLQRLCVATRTVRPVSDLIRFVVGPDGAAIPDLKRKLPGRGVWVTGTRDILADAIKRRAFARGFKRDVRASDDLVGQTERLLERSALDALAMTAKAGLVAVGFAKAETALQEGEAIALLHATEASPEGVRKLDQVLRRRATTPAVEVIGTLTSAQLDLALGRPNVVHAALLGGTASETFLTRLRRLERFRSGDRPVELSPEPVGREKAERLEVDADD